MPTTLGRQGVPLTTLTCASAKRVEATQQPDSLEDQQPTDHHNRDFGYGPLCVHTIFDFCQVSQPNIPPDHHNLHTWFHCVRPPGGRVSIPPGNTFSEEITRAPEPEIAYSQAACNLRRETRKTKIGLYSPTVVMTTRCTPSHVS